MERRQLWGYIDKNGEYIISPKFDGASDFSEGLAVVKIDWSRGYVDKAGKFVIEPQFQQANSFSEGLACVMLDDKWGYINKEGIYVIPLQYDNAKDFHNGVASVKIGEDWVYIDKAGQRVSPVDEPNDAESQHSEWPALKQEGDKLGYVDEKGEFVIPPSYIDAAPFYDGVARVKRGRTSKWEFINTMGKPAFKEKFEAAGDFHEGAAKVLVKV